MSDNCPLCGGSGAQCEAGVGAAVTTAEDCAVKHCDALPTLGMTVVIAGLRVELYLCETHFDQLDRNLSVHKDGEDVWRMLAFVVGAVGGKVTIYPRDLREGPPLLTREDGLDGEVRLLAHGPDAEFRAKTGMITEEEADSIAAAQQRRHVMEVQSDFANGLHFALCSCGWDCGTTYETRAEAWESWENHWLGAKC